jgi:5-methylcytosine-specific restriction protein A
MQKPKRQAGRPWQRLRRAILQASPLCVNCEAKGRVAAAVEIDHVIPLAHGGTDDLANLRALCRDCHLDETRRQFGRRHKPRIGNDGWPID